MLNFWSDRPVLVTGATGMIGSWLVKALLRRGARVAILLRDPDPQSELIRSHDIDRTTTVNGVLEEFWEVERAINDHEIDTVFHLGAQTIVGAAHRFPLPTFESNIRGSYNVLEASRIHANLVRKIIVASSDKAYGTQPVLPYTEDMPLIGRAPYEVSKTCTDLIAQSYAHTYQTPVAIARCGNVYGGGDLNWSRIVPGTIRALLHAQRPVVRSDGSFVRDYIYVDDIVDAYLLLAEAETNPGEAYNFGLEKPVTVLQMVDAIRNAAGVDGLQPDIQSRAPGEIHSQWVSAAKARFDLNWRPRYSLEEGLAHTIAWYASFLSIPVPSRAEFAVR